METNLDESLQWLDPQVGAQIFSPLHKTLRVLRGDQSYWHCDLFTPMPAAPNKNALAGFTVRPLQISCRPVSYH